MINYFNNIYSAFPIAQAHLSPADKENMKNRFAERDIHCYFHCFRLSFIKVLGTNLNMLNILFMLMGGLNPHVYAYFARSLGTPSTGREFFRGTLPTWKIPLVEEKKNIFLNPFPN